MGPFQIRLTIFLYKWHIWNQRNSLHRNYAPWSGGEVNIFAPPSSSKPPSSNCFGSVFIRCWHRHGAVPPAWQRAAHRYRPDGTFRCPEWYDARGSISATTTGWMKEATPNLWLCLIMLIDLAIVLTEHSFRLVVKYNDSWKQQLGLQ